MLFTSELANQKRVYTNEYHLLQDLYLEEVHDGKLVPDAGHGVLHSEVKPLGVFVGVQVVTQPQLVFIALRAVIEKELPVSHVLKRSRFLSLHVYISS